MLDHDEAANIQDAPVGVPAAPETARPISVRKRGSGAQQRGRDGRDDPRRHLTRGSRRARNGRTGLTRWSGARAAD